MFHVYLKIRLKKYICISVCSVQSVRPIQLYKLVNFTVEIFSILLDMSVSDGELLKLPTIIVDLSISTC